MGTGREIGSRLRAWMAAGRPESLSGRLLEGVMLDALGGETRLRGALRDLAFQPLLAKLLQERSPALRRSLCDALLQQLAAVYTPPVLAELGDLLEAAADLPPGPRPGPSSAESWGPPGGAAASGSHAPGERPSPSPPASSLPSPPQPQPPSRPFRLPRTPGELAALLRHLALRLQPLAPGLALAFAAALVLRWLGGELERLRPPAWSSALQLVLALALLQLLLLRPLASLRRRAPLRLQDSGHPRRAWRWITAPWVHHRQGEALLNGLMLLILLGTTPLPLGPLLLRYQLSSLASLLPAVLLARHWQIQTLWDGATGAVSALIALAAGVSLLQGQVITYPFGVLTVPVWVLVLVYGAIQMAWVLPSPAGERPSEPWQRLLSSCWCWGSLLGLLWACLSRFLAWAGPLLRQAAAS